MQAGNPNNTQMGQWAAPQGAAASDSLRAADYVISGSNALVAAANPLLVLIPQIRSTRNHPSPSDLRLRLIDEIRQFELRAQHAGISNETILGARYCLCTALDEAAALTPWGGGGAWSANSLLVTFHNETWGGEKFFQLLAKLSQNPAPHIDLLELLYYCLALGFEGRYRVADNGRSQLETLRQRLLLILHNARGKYSPALSGHWQDKPVQNQLKRLPVPLWVVAVMSVALGLFSYLGFSWSLGDRSDQLFADIIKVKPPAVHLTAPVMAQPAVPVARTARLAQFLAPEIREDLLTVRDEADRSVVVLRGDGLFESGSDTVRSQYLPVLSRVADALNETSGNILVSGYSDNVPIKTVRFPSNWELSQARADSVKKLLDERLLNKLRVRAEGKAEADPVAPNDTPANRARNRRVEITLLVSPVASAVQENQ
ncbi:MAG: DotU family type VI secretion system protein [Advenella sp.]|jgi:type VI secretion system protein ImpK|uniref:DotU family type VI secretion system protein n=1 Tax=Advenella alkanexedens TaxID=1481665 RepID=UPI000AD62627|nr:DotU family type VI secretion system protein [Advenella alkanexedens]MDY0273225.1 DotU family type VI secretion system protein [Advenella sp.]NLN69034.1 DotU family type VI secretion system protein [Alcaligenaceae bacterium]NLY33441.1 DotU family type VI secretion system protein [Alcaligenaceae bacterium]WKU19528.1 DotU family type VI secretion system protein [Advenella alkanexedens]